MGRETVAESEGGMRSGEETPIGEGGCGKEGVPGKEGLAEREPPAEGLEPGYPPQDSSPSPAAPRAIRVPMGPAGGSAPALHGERVTLSPPASRPDPAEPLCSPGRGPGFPPAHPTPTQGRAHRRPAASPVL